jgi:hypothetical protein
MQYATYLFFFIHRTKGVTQSLTGCRLRLSRFHSLTKNIQRRGWSLCLGATTLSLRKFLRRKVSKLVEVQ